MRGCAGVSVYRWCGGPGCLEDRSVVATCCRLAAIDCRLAAANCRHAAKNCRLAATNCRLAGKQDAAARSLCIACAASGGDGLTNLTRMRC